MLFAGNRDNVMSLNGKFSEGTKTNYNKQSNKLKQKKNKTKNNKQTKKKEEEETMMQNYMQKGLF